MVPGETKEVGIRVNFDSADGRDWWLHFNHPRWWSEGSPNDPNPPIVTAYDLDGSGDGLSDTWVTTATTDTTPAVLYELVKIKGTDTTIERGRFIMPFTMTVVLER
jgi:hypothetical protein